MLSHKMNAIFIDSEKYEKKYKKKKKNENSNKYAPLLNHSMYYTWGNMGRSSEDT